MPKLSFTTMITGTVFTALITLTLLLLVPAYQVSLDLLKQERSLSHQRNEPLIYQLFESHLQSIARASATLAENSTLIQLTASRNLADAKTLLQQTINARAGDHIQAFAIQLKDGPLALVPGAALLNVYLPLADLASSQILPDTWTTLSTRQQERDVHLLRLSLPIISEPFGEVVGYLHSFVILNDNFWMLNRILSVTKADAIALYSQGLRIGALADTEQQLQLLDNTSAEPAGFVTTDTGVIEGHALRIDQGDALQIRLLLPDSTRTLLQGAFANTFVYGLIGALLVALLLLFALYRLIHRPLQQLVKFAESAASPGVSTFAAPGNYKEFDRLASAVNGLQQSFRQNESRVSAILINTPNLVFIKDRDLRYRMVNPTCARVIGRSADQITGLLDADLYPAELARAMTLADQQVLAQGKQTQIEYSVDTADQGPRDFLCTLFPLLDEAAKPDGIGAVAVDITEHKRNAGHLKLASQVFDCANEAILVLNKDKRILTCNPAYHRMSGFSEAEAYGQHFIPLTEQPEILGKLDRNGRLQSETVLSCANGKHIPIWLSISHVESDAENEGRFIAMFSDISQMKSAEQQLEYLSRYDSLTGLPNRQLFCERLTQMMTQADRSGGCVAVLFVDIDDFKSINESFGHSAGDHLLKETAKRIKLHLRAGDTLARLGSDEFSIILGNIPDASSSHTIARTIQQAFQTPFIFDSHEATVTCTIGISLYPDDATDAQTLLAQADTTAHHVKQEGRNGIHFFDNGVNKQALQRLQLNDGLRRALTNGELFLEFQPRFDIHGRKVLGAEALIRWRHPEQGLISPVIFITLAEESGMILELGPWVLTKACLAAAQWNQLTPYSIPVSVNVSPRQLRDPELISDICDALVESGLPPHLLELEITETVVIEDVNRILGTLNELRDMGISLSIDDFGTGYSSLMYLKKLPVTTVKIDRSFVMDIPGNPDDERLIEAIIAMAHSLRFKVVAEGIETREQQAFLHSLGCDELQGYLLARPGTSDALVQFALNDDTETAAEAPVKTLIDP